VLVTPTPLEIKMKSIRNSKGFTLIELMIVVVIIGILAAIAIPKFTQVSKSAKEAEAPPILKQIRSLELNYYQKNDTYATTIATLDGFDQSSTQGKYYTFSTNGTCAIATATSTAVASHQSMLVSTGTVYQSTSCS
jgi:prepilin-type N-terminal cleavage/methylation domain-containing protein